MFMSEKNKTIIKLPHFIELNVDNSLQFITVYAHSLPPFVLHTSTETEKVGS